MRARPGATITPQMTELPQERRDTPPDNAATETPQ
jgi:hypothetical protein